MSREIDCGGQGTEEWLKARLGVPSASNFSKVVTTKGLRSTSFMGYVNALIAEKLTGDPTYVKITEPMERGTSLEDEARAMYQLINDTEVRQVDFIKHPNMEVGCSPDGLIDVKCDRGLLGGLEIKCPLQGTHVEYLRAGKVPSKYMLQVQGCMFVTGRGYWDFMSYHPKMKPLIVRTYRDDDLINELATNLQEAVLLIEDGVDKFNWNGLFS
jgi:predicted phage-related endonuclease|tara:strand:+ start:873 stop:1511 length:639 start_codon:yes stop_codon:yes gene_type:complete